MVSPLRARAAAIATGILMATPAAAQTPDPAAPPPPPPSAPANRPSPPPAPRAPGAKAAQPKPATRFPKRAAFVPRNKRGHEVMPADGTPIASSPAFSRLEDGTTRIWLEVDRKVDVAENRAQGRVVYRLRGATVVQRTNQLALPTAFFNTPVERVQLLQQGPDLDLVIELREATELAHRVVETPRGMVLQVDFPRSVNFGREESAAPSRPRAKRRSTTQTLGGAAAPDDGPAAPVEDN